MNVYRLSVASKCRNEFIYGKLGNFTYNTYEAWWHNQVCKGRRKPTGNLYGVFAFREYLSCS